MHQRVLKILYSIQKGIQNLAKEQNSVPEYSEQYLNKLEMDQRNRLSYDQRDNRVEKRNKMIALIRKLKCELGEIFKWLKK